MAGTNSGQNVRTLTLIAHSDCSWYPGLCGQYMGELEDATGQGYSSSNVAGETPPPSTTPTANEGGSFSPFGGSSPITSNEAQSPPSCTCEGPFSSGGQSALVSSPFF